MEPLPSYFRRRAQEERATAVAATSIQAQRAHLELAFRFEKLSSELQASPGISKNPRVTLDTADIRAPSPSLGRAELGKVIGRAFPLPTSGAFPDLLGAIDCAEEARLRG